MKVIHGAGGVRLVPRAVQRARDDADAIRATAQAEGERAGEALARVRVACALDGVRDEVAGLACEVAGVVLRDALARDPAARDALLADALARVWRARRVLVLAHADDVEGVRALLREAAGEGDAVEVRASTEVGRGEVIVESDQGRIDARVDVMLSRVHRWMTPAEPAP